MEWPESRAAAVSLTYDDGLPDALDRAIPDLEERGLRGTFYLTTGKRCVRRRAADWRLAFERGHEIGSHSAHHPCRADAYPRPPRWLEPEMRLEGWSAGRMGAELDEAADWLRDNIGEDPWRTYAYPCGATAIGAPPDETAYGEAVRRRHFAARAAGGGPNDPATVDLLRIRSLMCVRPAIEDLVRFCEEARSASGWAVLMFHSIGGWRLRTRRSVHREILEFLVRGSFWVAPVRDVARHIAERRD